MKMFFIAVGLILTFLAMFPAGAIGGFSVGHAVDSQGSDGWPSQAAFLGGIIGFFAAQGLYAASFLLARRLRSSH